MRTWICALTVLSAFLVPGMVRGQESGFVCGTADSAVAATSENPPPGALSPSDPSVEARIIFIAFPDNPVQSLPVWAEELRSQLNDYIVAMSKGRQSFNISIVQRPDSPGDAWVTQQPASFYVSGGGGYGAVNAEVMQAIGAAVPNVWLGVEQVFAVHYQCAFACANPSTPVDCEGTCPYGGKADLGLSPDQVPGFTGTGTTQRVFYWPDLDTDLARQAAKWVAAHEYGHHLQMQHTPGADALQAAEKVNPGKYDVMRNPASREVARVGLVPYHPSHLLTTSFGPHWFSRVLITSDTEGLRIPDIRAANGAVYEVFTPRSTQSFLLANHQGTTPYDQLYGNTGLLIWHRLRNAAGQQVALDLESAVGKFNAVGQPDPVSGADPLEANPVGIGSPADFFDGVTRTAFACGTNPNTHRYSGDVYSSPQSLPTSVAFENIRREAATGDMLVDVFVTPKQKVLVPNGGESILEGQPYAIQWAARPTACITSVDLQVSSDGGSSFTSLAPSLANSGQYSWTPGVSGPGYRIRALSHDQAGGTGTDDSNANFSVIDVTAPAMVDDLTIDLVSETEAYLFWTAPGDNGSSGTATAYDLRYLTQLIDPANLDSATLAATSAPLLGGTLEQQTVTGLTPCAGYHFALKARDEAGNWATISNVPFTETACMGGGGGGFAARSVDGSDEGSGTAVATAGPDVSDRQAGGAASARSPAASAAAASGSILQPAAGTLVTETRRLADGAWRVLLRLATEADGLDPAASAITVEREVASGERDTLGRFTPGETENLLGLCALRERGRVAIPGCFRLEQVVARLRHRAQDYALVDAQHARLGALGSEFVANGGSPELLAGDVLDLTYAPASIAQPGAPSWYLLVRRQGAAPPIPFSQRRERGASVPARFALHQNEPNPAGISTLIRFDLPRESPVKLEVFDLLGRRVAILADGSYPAGSHNAAWALRDLNGGRVRPGVYITRITAGGFRAQEKLSVLP